jgi:hypothetical protein
MTRHTDTIACQGCRDGQPCTYGEGLELDVDRRGWATMAVPAGIKDLTQVRMSAALGRRSLC